MAEKTITVNRKAQHDYHILRTLEAGLSLLGTEIKSIREGKVSIREAYVRPDDSEMWLGGAHVGQDAPAASGGPGPPRPAGAPPPPPPAPPPPATSRCRRAARRPHECSPVLRGWT